MNHNYSPKTMLVTGGAGFIGANFIQYMMNQYPALKLVTLDKLTYAGDLTRLEKLPNPDNHHFVKGDITDAKLVAKLLREFSIDTVVHFAAESHVDKSINHPDIFVKTNVQGTYTLLHCTHKYWLEENGFTANQCRFHHISTDEVFGSLSAHDVAFTENHAYCPRSPYSASKAAADHLVRAYFHTFGLPVTVSHCSNNYGPYQHQEKFIPTIITACAHQQPIPVYGDGSNIRDWLYVDDHCTGIEAIIRAGQPGETYNIGGDNEQSNCQLVALICQLFDQVAPQNCPHHHLISFVTDRPGHDWRYAIDTNKIKRELAWQAKQSFHSGLLKTIEFYRNRPA